MIDNPSFFKVEGTGRLFSGDISLSVEFEIFLITSKIVIYCTSDNSAPIVSFFSSGFDWTLEGETINNESVYASQLLMSNANDSFIELVSNNNVIIGNYFNKTADRIECLVANLYDINLNFSYKSYRVILNSEKSTIKKNISNFWEIPQTACVLTIDNPGASINEYSDLINHLIGILSLSTGRHLSVGIKKLYNEEKSYTFVQNVVTSHKSVSEFIPHFEVQKLIESGVRQLELWEESKKSDFKIILEYINSLNTGYLDERVLSIIQCFEIISNNWIKGKPKLSPELQALKLKLKDALKSWRNDYPELDENGFWSGRVIASLDWEKTVTQLINVIDNYNLNNEKININFRKLVDLRHSVAHNGRFGAEEDKKLIINELLKGQFALRLILTSELNYKGKIYDYKSNFKTIVESEEYRLPANS